MDITDWDTHRKKLLKNPKLRQALAENELEYRVARTIIEARVKHKMTQADLARKLKTKQSAISRLERGNISPSIDFLNRLAHALDLKLRISFGI